MSKLATDPAQSPLPRAGTTSASSRPRPRIGPVALALTVAAAALVSLWPNVAAAQTITLVGQYPQRMTGGQASTRQPRGDDDYASNIGIDRLDCDSDETWKWAFAIPPAASFTFFDVWASTSKASCADVTARATTPPATPQPTATCWHVARYMSNQVLNANVVSFKSSDIVKAVYRLTNVDDPAMTSTKEICYPAADQQPMRFYLHFLLIGADGVTAVQNATTYESVYDTTYDLQGPTPPDGVTLGAGAQSLVASWVPSTTLDKDLLGYRAYCFPTVGSVGQQDAGASEAGAADAGAACPTLPAGFGANVLPSRDVEAMACGSSQVGSHSMQIDGLVGGTTYAVAIAAIDKYGNSGPLSNVACLAPNGPAPAGTAGGGSCSFGSATRAGWLGWLGGVAALGLLARRRRGVQR
jgi:hypothetical protein